GNQPLDCCFSFYHKVIPVSVIKKYKRTRTDYRTVGVVFTTKKNIHVCVDAGLKWVQAATKEIDRRLLHGTTNLTMRPDPTTDQDGYETEAQTGSTPDTTRTDSAEPTWFCQIET
ncbi:hypothetical protein NFI96_030393, partial [Prochilodus magdalenae]